MRLSGTGTLKGRGIHPWIFVLWMTLRGAAPLHAALVGRGVSFFSSRLEARARKGARPRAMRAVRSALLEAGETVRKPVRLLLAAS